MYVRFVIASGAAVLLLALSSVFSANQKIHANERPSNGHPLASSGLLSAKAEQHDDLWGLLAQFARAVESPTKGLPQIHRVQLTVKTSRAKGAQTDDAVQVALGPNCATWINAPGNDRERGKVETHDLLFFDERFTNPLRTLRDIKYLELTKTGKDDWYITFLELSVNGQRVYREDFSPDLRLGNDSGSHRTYRIEAATLRESADWQNFRASLPALAWSRAELESRLEGIVGNFLHGIPKAEWGDYGKGVRVSYFDDQTLHIRIDVKRTVNNWFDPDFNLELNVRFVQFADRLEIQLSGIKVDGNGVTGELVEGKAGGLLKKVFAGREKTSIKFRGLPFGVRVLRDHSVEVVFGQPPAPEPRVRNIFDEEEARYQKEVRDALRRNRSIPERR